MQVRLLRVLQEYKVRPVGSEESKEISFNARVMVATNRDLRREVAEGRFRRDLYYRVNVFSIRSPALRDRFDDLPLLIDVLLNRLIGRSKLVRPLRESDESREIILSKGLNCLRNSRATTVYLHRRQELDLYLTELAQTGGNLTKAARRLGINRSTLHTEMKLASPSQAE